MSRRPPVEYETLQWKGHTMVPVNSSGTITLLPPRQARRQHRAGNVDLISVDEWGRLQAENSALLDGAYK